MAQTGISQPSSVVSKSYKVTPFVRTGIGGVVFLLYLGAETEGTTFIILDKKLNFPSMFCGSIDSIFTFKTNLLYAKYER